MQVSAKAIDHVYLEGIQTSFASPSLHKLQRIFSSIRRLAPELPVLGIFWLHIKHPLHPIQEKWPAKAKMGDFSAKSFWICFAPALCLAYGIYFGLKIALIKIRLRKSLKALRQRSFSVLIKTWGFGIDLAAKETDFYFGDLAERLFKENISTLFICGNAGALSFTRFSLAYTSIRMPYRIPEYALIAVWAPVRAALQQIRSAFKLSGVALRSKNMHLRCGLWYAARDVMSRQTLRDILQFDIATNAVRHWHPETYVTLYEGHAWEKCAWSGVKNADRQCRTVGYQHTAIFQESIALTQPVIDSPERSVPDIVLSIGEITQQLMIPGHRSSDVLCFGSFRHSSGRAVTPSKASLKTVLVTPEGLLPEMQMIFKFAYESALLRKDIHFIIRTHPALPLESVLADLPRDFLRIPNIEVSKEPDIKVDFERSSHLLYRGSSTVLYAIAQGLRPLYLHSASRMDTDPLYDLKSWRFTCTTPQDLSLQIDRDQMKSERERQPQWREAVDYVSRYTMPLQEKGFRQFVQICRSPLERAS